MDADFPHPTVSFFGASRQANRPPGLYTGRNDQLEAVMHVLPLSLSPHAEKGGRRKSLSVYGEGFREG